MFPRISCIVVAFVLVATSCGDRLSRESPNPIPTVFATPEPTTLSLAELIRRGTLRVGFNQLNSSCMEGGPGGETGPCVDIARSLAAQLRTTLIIFPYSDGNAMADAGLSGHWDVAFVDVDLTFPKPGIDASPAYLVLEQTYLVRGDSPYRSVADVDRPDVRIACRPSVIKQFLTQTLKSARIIDVPSIAAGALQLEQGRAEAYAASRDEVVAAASLLANARVLDDSITSFRWGIAVASGRTDLLAYVTQFIESSKKNGVIQDAINRHQVAGARVAP